MWWHFLVLIEVEPARTRNLNIVGFGVVALTDDDRIVGRFLDQRDVLIASCDPLLEGSTAFHARPAAKRSSLKLVWLPGSRNYGKVHFRLVTLFFPSTYFPSLCVCVSTRENVSEREREKKEKEDEITVANLPFTRKVINNWLHLFTTFCFCVFSITSASYLALLFFKVYKYLALVIVTLTVYYQLDADNFCGFFFSPELGS